MNLADNHLDGASWIYQRIYDYCEIRANGIGGYYQQRPYKDDFFKIFADAFIGGFCGYEAQRRLAKQVGVHGPLLLLGPGHSRRAA